MLFNSAVYIFAFLPAVFLVWALLTRFAAGQAVVAFLTVASWAFYAWWYPAYLLILLGLLLLNFGIARVLVAEADQRRRWFVATAGIAANLAVLFWFKYFDFAARNVADLLGLSEPKGHSLLLPLGISFITFQKIAFLADLYQKKVADVNFWRYSLFVSFFPQLIAGPIVHHSEVMPQFADSKNQRIDSYNIGAGLFLFTIGLFKKVALADNFAVWANMVFDTKDHLPAFAAWVGAFCYAFQIYWDFSGYTDMALGAALLFNVRLPVNFDLPYKAKSLTDFWNQWHITLGRWFRQYLYIPLGGGTAQDQQSRCAILSSSCS